MITIKNDYELKDIVICALRYSLGRRTYITRATADFIKDNPKLIDKRVKNVMLNDLKQYFDERKQWEIKDDSCDYETWLDLKQWLEKIEV